MSQETDEKILKILEKIEKYLEIEYPTIFCEHEFTIEVSPKSKTRECKKCGKLLF